MGIEIGVLGALFILSAWILETLKEIKKHKSYVDLKFSYMIAIGGFLFIIYSWQIGDPVFFWFNIIIEIVILLDIAYAMNLIRQKRK